MLSHVFFFLIVRKTASPAAAKFIRIGIILSIIVTIITSINSSTCPPFDMEYIEKKVRNISKYTSCAEYINVQKIITATTVTRAAFGCLCPKSLVIISRMQAKKADIRTAIRNPLPLNPPNAVPNVHALRIISKTTVNTNIIISPKTPVISASLCVYFTLGLFLLFFLWPL